jgi:hypothetical protein
MAEPAASILNAEETAMLRVHVMDIGTSRTVPVLRMANLLLI